MKRLCTILAAASVMFWSISSFTSCKKSSAALTEDQPNETEKTYPVYSPDNTSIGSINISKQSNGDAKVKIALDKAILNNTPPYKPMFQNSGMEGQPLILAYLNDVSIETAISETTHVISTNRGLPFSYDAMMFTRVLKLVVTDGK
jgi:hypothetical protein